MTFWLSDPIETKLRNTGAVNQAQVDYLIVGSGYGAAMAALALGETLSGKASIWVLEKGDEYVPDDFPKTMEELPRHLNYLDGSRSGPRRDAIRNDLGLFEIRNGKGISTLSGSGLGGTSLINANVAAEPEAASLQALDAASGSTLWSEEVPRAFGKIRELLGAKQLGAGNELPKYVALANTVRKIAGNGNRQQDCIQLAELTINKDVNTEGNPYPHSAWHGACNNCGNCVIGCHSGAKQSLNMNAWPLAKQLGVEMYTGANVRVLERTNDADGHEWLVKGYSSRNSETTFEIRARRVILAAGTIGSAEILRRSRNGNGLKFSPQLGKRFSANGDALFSSVGENRCVNAVAKPPHADANRESPCGSPGPTIVGKGHVDLPFPASAINRRTVTLEDGVIPYPLIHLWQEMITTQSFLYRYESNRRTGWHAQHEEHDYLAISPDLAAHSQVLLVMGDDRAVGELATRKELKERFPADDDEDADCGSDETPDNDAILPYWPSSQGSGTDKNGPPDYFQLLHSSLRQLDRSRKASVFNGGQYHPNPVWKLLPDEFAYAVEGADTVEDKLVSVHPLGGCGMGASSDTGVVNHLGQVYTGVDKTGVFDSLYILDGSIIPGAIGTNPFLTIAASAYILAGRMAGNDEPWLGRFPVLDKTRFGSDWLRIPAGNKSRVPETGELAVEAKFKERFAYHIDRDRKAGMPWSPKGGPTLAQIQKLLGARNIQLPVTTASLVLDTEIRLREPHSLDQWLEHPDRPLPAVASLKYDRFGSVHTISDAHCIEIATLRGQITLGKLYPAKTAVGRLYRSILAFIKYQCYRPYDENFIKKLFKKRLNDRGLLDFILKVPRNILGLFRTAGLHADWRQMHYVFTADPASGLKLSFEGTKTIAYAAGQKDLLRSLMTIDTTVHSADTDESLQLTWEMDSVRTTNGPAPLQVVNQLHLMHALSTVGGALAYFGRVLMQTNFWSFGAHDYARYKTLDVMNKMKCSSRLQAPCCTITYGDGKVSAGKEEWHWNEQSGAWEKTPPQTRLCRLLRYQPAAPDPEGNRKVLLLIHGLAHSSRVFWAHTIDENFVQYFLGKDYDVWIMDHRTSANYVKDVNPRHTWDQIAHEDVANAVRFVYNTINAENSHYPKIKRKVHVFSHCIGAGATCIALLSGELAVNGRPEGVQLAANGEGAAAGGGEMDESMLASLVPHAVTPWLYTSVENRARANIWALFKELDLFKVVDPYPHRNTKFREMVMDRLATMTLNEEEDAQWRVNECGDYKTDEKIKIGFWEMFRIRREDKRDKRGPGFPRAIYLRYTIIWGRQWFKKNVNRKTRRDFASMIGATPIDVMQQVYFSVTRGMLSNHEGNNVYVKHDNIARHWGMPTLFFHGDKNTVFDMESSRSSAYMLTQHRRQQKNLKRKTELLPSDYLDQQVWIDILPDYGHMDIIFGQRANCDVYPKLHEFFSAAEAIARQQGARYFSDRKFEFSQPDKIAYFAKTRGSGTHASPIKRPLTGPIISHPLRARDANGEIRPNAVTLRLWCEVQDFTSMPPRELIIRTDEANSRVAYNLNENMFDSGFNTRMVKAYAENADEISCLDDMVINEDFWLNDHSFDPGFDGPRYLWLSSDSDDGNHAKESAQPPRTHIRLDWHKLDWLKRISDWDSSESYPTRLSFLVGSCFYPGTTFDNEQSFAVYEGMYRHVEPPQGSEFQGVDHILLLGDQIYADATAGVFDSKTGYQKYRDRYRKAWSNKTYPFISPVRKLFSHVPTYFAVDDHEFEDNYQGVLTSDLERRLFVYAKRMAWLYQIHQDNWTRTRLQLHHSFESAGIPFFVFDTRMKRKKYKHNSRMNVSSLMGKGQLADFREWLKQQQEADSNVLFLASGSPFIPLNRSILREHDLLQDGDTLASYPGFIIELISCLTEYARDKYVVWLSGDPHLSCYAPLRFERVDAAGNKQHVNFLHVCSSGLYEPMAFINVNSNSVDWGQRVNVTIPPSDIHLTSTGQHLLSDHAQHFVRIQLRDSKRGLPAIDLIACGANGESINRYSGLELSRVVSDDAP